MIDGAKPAVYERILGRKAGKMIWSGAPRAYIDSLRKQKKHRAALWQARPGVPHRPVNRKPTLALRHLIHRR